MIPAKHFILLYGILLSSLIPAFNQSPKPTSIWQFMSPGGGNVVQVAGDENTLMVLTGKNGFYISNNSGGSWNKANTGLNSRWRWLEFNSQPNLVAADGKFFIVIEDSLFCTDASKINWISIAVKPDYYDNKLLSTGKEILAKTSSGIVILNQEQKSWDIIKAPAEYGNLYVIDDLLFYYGDEVYRSEDQGKNWTSTGHYAEQIISFKDKLYSFYGGDCFVSSDTGKKWEKTSNIFPECEKFLSTSQMLFFVRNDSTFFRSSVKAKWSTLPFKVKNYDTHILSVRTTTFIPSVYDGLKVTANNGRTWSQRNKGLNILNASKICFQDNSIFLLSDSIVYISEDNGKTWDRLKNEKEIIFPDDQNEYTVLCNGESCIEMIVRDSGSPDNKVDNSWFYTLKISDSSLNPAIDVSGLASIKPFRDTVHFNSFTAQDSMIYICTNEGVYYKTIASFLNDYILDFFIGRWGSGRDLNIEADKIYYYGIQDKDGEKMIVQFSCGEYYSDSAGELKERIPQLTFKTEKVNLITEIDTSLAFNGFEIKGNRLVIDGSSIPIHEVYALRNNCVYSDLQNLYLINREYILLKQNNEYYLKKR